MTYVKTAAGRPCLAVVAGLCTRMVVGWSMADNMRAALVVDALKMAWHRGYVAWNAIFHSDYAEENAKPRNHRNPLLGAQAAGRTAA